LKIFIELYVSLAGKITIFALEMSISYLEFEYIDNNGLVNYKKNAQKK